MQKLARNDLWSLEQYSTQRSDFRQQVIEHKKVRRVTLGEHAILIFEDFLTMKYQVQEMLRVEKIFEAAEIEEELAAYNPLIPDGDNWKATLQIEYSDVEQRRRALARMPGIEHKIWCRAGSDERVFAIANEDLERSTDEKTSAVHFLRFQLTPAQISAVKSGAAVEFGIDHPELPYQVTVDERTRDSLAADLA